MYQAYLVLLVALFWLPPVYSGSYSPTKYNYLEQLQFPQDASIVAQISSDVILIFIGFSGSSHNVSIYIMDFANPDSNSNGKKGSSASYSFVQNLTQALGDISSISMKPQYDLVAVASADRKLRTYVPNFIGDSVEFILRQQIDDSVGPLSKVLVSNNGNFMVTVSNDSTVRIYYNETISPKVDMTLTRASANKATPAAASSNLTTLAQGWAYKLYQTVNNTEDVGSVAFAFNESTLYVGFDNGSLVGYHLRFEDINFHYNFTITDSTKMITAIAINDAGKILSTGSGDGFVRIYNTDVFGYNTKLVQGIYDANNSISKVNLRTDGYLLIASSTDGKTRVYNSYGSKYVLNETFKSNSPSNSMGSEGQVVVVYGGNTLSLYQSCLSSLFKCSLCNNSNTCYGCIDNYYVSRLDGYCYSCPLYQGCKTCLSQVMCTSCYSGYFLDRENGVCQPCPNSLRNCKSCSSEDVCIECFLEFTLSKGACELPVNPSIPSLKSKLTMEPVTFVETLPNPDLSLRTDRWMLTVIILIIVVCVLIIILLIVLTILCVKVAKRARLAPMHGRLKGDKEFQAQGLDRRKSLCVGTDQLREPPLETQTPALKSQQQHHDELVKSMP